jgi:mono/diheme cytochrome c family protein
VTAGARVLVLATLAVFAVQGHHVASGFRGAPKPRSGEGGSRTVSTTQQPARTINDAVYTIEQTARGEPLYQQQCAACHGQALAGVEAAPALAGPAFFGSWNEAPLGDLFERIRISMPQDKPGSLSRQQTSDIVAYILSFNKAPAGKIDLPGDTELLKAIKIVAPK